MTWGAARPPLGPYRLVQRLGEGGMGEVHLGLDPSGRAVAVKVLRAHVAHDPDARARLAREVQTLQRVRHPLVAEVLDADVDGDRPYVVTRYVPGPSLDEVVRDHGPVPAEGLVRVGRGLADALGAIHAAGVVHRDLKPGNILILDSDPVLIDFGIAHVADDIRLTSAGLVMGTPGYLSPEVVAGDEVTPATDWWGWAASLAFAATGRPPFGRGPMDVVLDRVRSGDADLDGVDPALAPLLRAALSVSPQDRPGAAELLAGLERFATARTVEVPHVVPAARTVVVPQRAAPTVTVPAPAPARAYAGTSAPATPPATPVTWADPTTPYPPYEAAPYAPTQVSPYAAPAGANGAGPWPPTEVSPYADRSDDPLAAFRDQDWSPPPPQVPRRAGTMLAVFVALVGLATARPVVVAAAFALLVLLARTVDRSATFLLRRRRARGRTSAEGVLVAVTSPWHLLVAALATVVSLLLPVLLGASAAFLTGLALGAALPGGDPRPGSVGAVAVGAFVAVLAAWWGPGGSALRRGARSTARGMLPGPRTTVVAVCVLLGAGVVGALAAWTVGQPDWWPLLASPLGTPLR